MTDAPRFRVRVEPRAGATIIAVVGELDSATCDRVSEVFEHELAGPQPGKLLLDLRGVTFVDSAAMRTLIQAQRKADQGAVELEVLPAPEEVTALLRIAGVAGRMNVVSSSPAVVPEDFLERIDMELKRELTAPARTRAELREVFGATLDQGELATLVLLASELMTNAVVHPAPNRDRRLGLRITSYPERVRVEVDDPGAGFDPATPIQPTDEGGRGLMLVDRVSVCWGAESAVTPRGERFTVWFELALDQPEAQRWLNERVSPRPTG